MHQAGSRDPRGSNYVFAVARRLFQGEESINSLTSMNQLVAIERELEQALVKVRERKGQLGQEESQLALMRQVLVVPSVWVDILPHHLSNSNVLCVQ